MSALPEEIKTTYLIAMAIGAMFILFIAVFVIVYRNRQTALYNETILKDSLLKQQKLEAELQQIHALQTERDRISIDMHDDLGSGLSSIKLISEMLKKKHQDIDTQNDLNDIVERAKELTSTMRDMVWSLNPRNDNLLSLSAHLIKYANYFFEHSTIQLKTTNGITQENILVNSHVRRNILLCVKEILNNIVKHARATSVTFNLKYEYSQFQVLISDDGQGLPENIIENNGFYSMRKRIQDCSGSIEWNNLEKGLQIDIVVPIQI
jgi:two-component system sensor histidine kinase DesK